MVHFHHEAPVLAIATAPARSIWSARRPARRRPSRRSAVGAADLVDYTAWPDAGALPRDVFYVELASARQDTAALAARLEEALGRQPGLRRLPRRRAPPGAAAVAPPAAGCVPGARAPAPRATPGRGTQSAQDAAPARGRGRAAVSGGGRPPGLSRARLAGSGAADRHHRARVRAHGAPGTPPLGWHGGATSAVSIDWGVMLMAIGAHTPGVSVTMGAPGQPRLV